MRRRGFSVRERSHDVQRRLRCVKCAVCTPRRELRATCAEARQRACSRRTIGLGCRSWRLEDSPALRAAALQYEDILLIRVWRRRRGRPFRSHVKVQAVGQLERVHCGEAHGAEGRDGSTGRIEHDRPLLEGLHHVDVSHLGVLKGGAPGLRHRSHLPAAWCIDVRYAPTSVEKIVFDRVLQLFQREGARHAVHVLEQHRHASELLVRKLLALCEIREKTVICRSSVCALDITVEALYPYCASGEL